MQESSFLAALRADPDDRLLRLAYADWLEERDDPRGELIRIEEEMRRLPVFADRFWELKPRRNELCTAASPAWHMDLGYGTVVEPVFRHGVPDGWKERWRLIREFTERWHRIQMPDVGGRQDEIRDAEARLGRTLPPSVREYVAFAFDVRQQKERHDVLRDFFQMQDLDGFDALSLLIRCEGDYHWAVSHSDLTEDDPPVRAFFEFDDGGTFAPDGPDPIAPSVTVFVLMYAFGYMNGTGGSRIRTEIDDPTELFQNLEATYPAQTTFEAIRIFEGDDIHIRLTPDFETLGYHVVVEFSELMPREAIPEFLLDLTSNGESFQGTFIPPERGDTDDIPF